MRPTNGAKVVRSVATGPAKAESSPPENRSHRRSQAVQGLLRTVQLSAIMENCRLKAEATRWQVQRAESVIDQHLFSEVKRIDKGLAESGQKRNVHLWMNDPDLSTTDERWNELADAFELLSDGLKLVSRLSDAFPNHEDLLRQSIPILYEIQNHLGTVTSVVTDRADKDQIAVCNWSRHASNVLDVRINSAASKPLGINECRTLLKTLNGKLDDRKVSGKKRKSLLGKLEYEANRILDFDEMSHAPDWSTFNRTVSELSELGEPASSLQIREHLEAVRYLMPVDLKMTPALELAVTYFDRATDKNPDDETQAKLAQDRDYSSERVLKVRALLRGRKIAIVGGDATPEKIERIKNAFELADIDWVSTHHHTQINKIAPSVQRADNVLVLLLIRWASHVYNDLVKLDKVFVKVTAGYNPNQLAEAILTQASGRL